MKIIDFPTPATRAVMQEQKNAEIDSELLDAERAAEAATIADATLSDLDVDRICNGDIE